jgi:hypothetical protein
MVEAKCVRIFSIRSQDTELWVIGAEFVHVTGEQRAGQIGLRAFSPGEACMLQQIFAIAMATGTFGRGTSVQPAVALVFGMAT